MSLRARVLGLFLMLAAFPLLVLGVLQYVQALRAVERLIADQNGRIAERVADAIHSRAALLESDLLLLSENADTQRWLLSRAGDASGEAEAEGRRFLESAWSRLSTGYAGFRLTRASGETLYEAGRDGPVSPGTPGTMAPVERPVRDLVSGRIIGTVYVQPILETMVPVDVITAGFGLRGNGMVVDRSAERILYHSNPVERFKSPSEVLGPEYRPGRLEGTRGTFRYSAGGEARVASFASTTALPWTVVMSGAVDEFAAPFANAGRSTLLLFVLVALTATLVFAVSLQRTTRSLEELLDATAEVAKGDFAPRLPPQGTDEVGRLSSSFEAMANRVGEMMEQVRTSRQMAVLGEFAAQLSHEIRNPLTSIKLNLQKIERETRGHPADRGTTLPLDIALREVQRLDGVVRGVLDLTRQEMEAKEVRSAHALVRDALEVISEQAVRQAVAIDAQLEATNDLTALSANRIKGALINVLLNALEAMPEGGTLQVASANTDGGIELSFTDTGPGIPASQRATIFRPFATTKPGGTGLGLPLARRAVEDHGGTLDVEEHTGGARLVMRLPLRDA